MGLKTPHLAYMESIIFNLFNSFENEFEYANELCKMCQAPPFPYNIMVQINITFFLPVDSYSFYSIYGYHIWLSTESPYMGLMRLLRLMGLTVHLSDVMMDHSRMEEIQYRAFPYMEIQYRTF